MVANNDKLQNKNDELKKKFDELKVESRETV